MRRAFAYAFLLSIVVVSMDAVGQESEKAIRKLLVDQVDAWNAGDLEGYMKGYWNSDSTKFVSGGTLTHGYREVLARYKRTYESREKMGNLEFSDLAVRTVGSRLAIATGIWRLIRAKDQPWGRFTLIIEEKAEGWRIVYDHTSSAD